MNKKDIDNLKKKRAARPPAPEQREPGQTNQGGRLDPETILPLNPWTQTVDLCLNSMSLGMGVPLRSKTEKEALAIVSRNYIVTKTGGADAAPGLALAFVAIPIGASMLWDLLAKRRKVEKTVEPKKPNEPPHGDTGPVGNGQVIPNEIPIG